MEIRIAALADYASISEGSKLNILGIFTQIFSEKEPIINPQMQLVVQFEFEPSEASKKDFKVVLQDDDAREIFSLSGEMEVPRARGPEPAIVNQVLKFNNVTFPKFGGYEFQVLIGGEVKAKLPVKVLKAQETHNVRA